MNDKLLKYFDGDELAASTWQNKYAFPGEETPDDMHRRMAREFAKLESCTFTEDYIYNLFKDFKYVIPGGSIMASLGSNSATSLSNCFVIESPKDSYTSIMRARTHQIHLMKRRGGVGYDLSNIRPAGSPVHNAAKSATGVSSFMEVCSSITKEVAQDGRRGALMLTVDIRHPDSLAFIEIKQDLTKVTGANVSVKVTDDFMEAVENDKDYILRYPLSLDNTLLEQYSLENYEYNKLEKINMGYIKRIKARELWDKLIYCAHNTAEPGILFIDRIHNYSPEGDYEDAKAISTNPCQPEWAPVLTPDGIRTFKDIDVGSTIWSSEGWTNVVKKECSGIKDVYNYKTTAGIFSGTDTHKIVSKGNKIEVKNAKSIDVLAGIINPNFSMSPIDIMDGLIIGDGSVHTASNNLVYLCIGEKDQDYFTSEIQSLIIKHRPGIKSYAYTVESTIQADELPLTFERHVPERFYKGYPEKVKGFLRGLYSANGSVIGNRVVLKTASPYIRDEVQLLLSSIGIRSYYTTNKPKKVKFSNGDYNCRENYDINISTDRHLFYIFIGFLQKYKMDALLSTFNNFKVSNKTHNIVETKWISKEPVYNITVDNKSHTYWTGGLNVANCGEIPLGPYDSCRLIHINFTSFIENPFTKEAHINTENLSRVAYDTMVLADLLVDLEIEAVDRIIAKTKKDNDPVETEVWENINKTARKYRRTGVGFTGLADAIAMLGYRFGSEESLEVIDFMMRVKLEAELNATIDRAMFLGSFPGYNEDNEGNNDWYQFIEEEFPEIYESMELYGRRNLSFSTVAPTGTVSIMARVSSGIEPVFMPYYMRRRKVSNNTDKTDFIDEVGEKFTEFPVIHPIFKKWVLQTEFNIPPYVKNSQNYIENNWSIESWEEAFKASPWYSSTSPEIPWKERVEIQRVVQKYTTHAISSTVNLPESVTKEEIDGIYRTAWKQGLKGITVYRDNCRQGILNKIDDKSFEVEPGRQAIKRPKVLDADYYQVKSKGIQYIVLVGLLNNKPYEVFTFQPTKPVDIKPHRGKIIKIKKGQYAYDSDFIKINDLQLSTDNIEEKACSLYTSMLLRHGANIKFIIKTAKKVNENISSFSSAMCRVLSKYTENEEVKGESCPQCGGKLLREGGCVRCLDCDYSKCL